jgi:two-component system OmpR family response regulator
MTEPLIVTPFDKLRFLAVDDDRAILELVDALLRSAGAGSVIKSASGLGAVNILADQRKRADCIICDHTMPNMTGLDLLRDIRAGKYEYVPRDIHFIMITAHGQEAVVRAAIGLDVSGYIVKPIRKDGLIKAIHRAFGRPPLALKTPDEYLTVTIPADP